MTKQDVALAWERVADELSSLGLKLKLHIEEEFTTEDAVADSEAPDVADDVDVIDVEAGVADGPDDLHAAFVALSEALAHTADTVSDVVTDPAIHADVRDAGGRLVDALTTSLAEVGKQARARTPGF